MQNYFLLKNIFKKFHNEILDDKFHGNNLFCVKKIFSIINKKIFNAFILENGRSDFKNLDLEKFLNFYFENPNQNLQILLNYGLKEFRKINSVIIFCFDKFKNEFFKFLYFLNEEKWKNFEKNIFDDSTKKQFLLSECILFDHCIKYFEDLFL